MIKKFLSVLLSVSMLLSMVSYINVFAATSEFAKLDLSGYNESSYYSKDGANMKVCYTTIDGVKCIAIGKRNTAFVTSDGYSHQINNTVSFSNSTGLSSDTIGIVSSTTFRVTSKADHAYMTTNTGIRYIDIYNGNVRTCNASNTAVNTGLTYDADKWYTVKLSLNYTTGYYIIELTDVASGATTTAKGTRAEWILDAEGISAVTYFKWAKENATGNIYFSEFNAQSENDSSTIAPPPPSKIVVRDDFDASESTTQSPWTSSTTLAETDRGNSAYFGSSGGTSLTVSNSEGLLNSNAKGLAVEFSTKLTYTSTKPNFVVSVNGNWYGAVNKIMQFMNNSNGVLRDGSNNKILSSWSKDKWYDVRIEIGFDSAGMASYRYIVNDGTTETVAVFKNVSTTLFDDPSAITKIQFTYATGDGKAYVDNVNIFWLDEAAASGIAKSTNSISVNNRFENFDEGTEDIKADMECDAPTSFLKYSSKGTSSFAIESVLNSGRGKSFKATVGEDSEYSFYRDFSAIENGVVSFDIMFPKTTGITLINAQTSTSENAGAKAYTLFRFDNWGNIKDAGNANVLGRYEAKKWYKVVLTAGSDTDKGGVVKFEVFGDNGLVADGAVSTGFYTTSSESIARNSIRYARIDMLQCANTLYVDNYKAYAPADTAYGIYPVGHADIKESLVTTENKFVLPFSKAVDLERSSFKVNGEEVTARGYEFITLNTAVEAGQEYEIEYTVYDFDGYKSYGYISGIKAENTFNVSDYTYATTAAPTASVTVSASQAAGYKEVKLFVAAYKDGEMIAIDCDAKVVDTIGTDFAATVDATGADEVRTFLWDGANLTPIK